MKCIIKNILRLNNGYRFVTTFDLIRQRQFILIELSEIVNNCPINNKIGKLVENVKK
jgi:hypothetical protein